MKNLILSIIICLFIYPVQAANPEQNLEDMSEHINLQESSERETITLSELNSVENQIKNPKNDTDLNFLEIKQSSIWDKNAPENSLTVKTRRSFFEDYENFDQINDELFNSDYTFKSLTKKEELQSKPFPKAKKGKWAVSGMDEKAGIQLYNLKASKIKAFPKKDEYIDKTWKFIKGKPVEDSILLGMFSHHTSDNRHNETHNLVGVDYKGYSMGVFKNSFSDFTYYGGITRKVYEHNFTKDVKFNVRYKVMVLNGYGDHYPDFIGFTPLVMPFFGVTFWSVGADFIVIPSVNPTFSVNFRLKMPKKLLNKISSRI